MAVLCAFVAVLPNFVVVSHYFEDALCRSHVSAQGVANQIPGGPVPPPHQAERRAIYSTNKLN